MRRSMVGVTVMLVAAAALGLAAAPAGAADAVTLPMTVPPGAPLQIDVTACPAATTSIHLAMHPTGAAAPLVVDVTVPRTEETTSTTLVLGIDTAAGGYTLEASCLDAAGATIDAASTPVTVAILPLTVSPSQGPPGTVISISGGGCPTGVTDVVAVRIGGASDQIEPWDPTDTNFVATPNNPDGTFSLTYTVPGTTPAGELAVQAFCISEGGSNLAGPGLGAFNVTLAVTGVHSGDAALLGVVLLVCGIGLVAVSGRSQRLRFRRR